MAEKQFQWIDTSVVLDFAIPNTLKNTIKEIEQADIENNWAEYNILSDTIDVLCKNYYTGRVLTKEQWDIVCKKYPMAL